MINKTKDKIRELKSSTYVRNVAKLATGTTLAQVASIITAPILYRIYDKNDYGTLGTYMAIVGVIGVFSTLRYNEAIMIEKDDKDAITVMNLNRMINIVFSIICVVFVLLFGNYTAIALNNPGLADWLYLVPVSIFFGGQTEIYKVWANRKEEYNLLTLNSILVAVFVPIFSISIGLMHSTALGLFVGLLASQVIPSILLYTSLHKKYTLEPINTTTFSKLKSMAIQHKDFPIYSLPADFINRLTSQLPVFMLGKYFGPSTVGVYNLCTRMLGLPIQLIASSISTVFREKAVKSFNEVGNCIRLFKSTGMVLALFAAIPVVVLLIVGPDLFAFFFGEKWREAGMYAQILAPMYFLSFIVGPLSYLYYIRNKQKEDLFLHIILLIVMYLIFIVFNNSTIERVMIFYSISMSVFYLFYFFRTFQFSHGHTKA